jgi:2-oxoglutarate dehydrogenase E2 component (dihydrolipoamide succinyltransferase)
MPIELKIPSLGESITEIEIGSWLKSEGDVINKDDNLVALESEKATVEFPAPASGTLSKILKRKGEKAAVGEVIGHLDPAQKASAETPPSPPPETPLPPPPPASSPPPAPAAPPPRAAVAPVETPAPRPPAGPDRQEEVVRMTPLRRAVARRLVESRQTTAMLTTFNEIDLSAVIALRQEYQEPFTRRHGVKLGFMSFFVKAAVEALRAVPQLNASVRGDDIVYYNYFDIGVAIGGEKGLVVPTLRNAQQMSFAEVEKAVADFAARARANKLTPDELQSGTFTITNGGVYGSLLSTPIINPPQSGILGMHAIQDRPVARGGNVVIRPMMYIALSYDHRIVDGREAVTFLARVKEMIETPARILLEI